MGWERWTTSDGAILAMRSFGASAPGDTLFKAFGFTPTGAAALVRDVLARSTR
jgi:transketolase